MAPPTILAHKTAFLTAQTLHLSQTLPAPSPAWQRANERADAAVSLPPRAVADALYRANHALQRHARRAYAPPAARHVAEQIEGLFLEAGERALRRRRNNGGYDDGEDEDGDGDGDGETGRLRVGVDLANPTTIAALPATWPSPRETQQHPTEAARYAALASSLKSLAARRAAATERVARLRRMAGLLAPFTSSSDPNDDDDDGAYKQEGERDPGVQPNLVTRDGALERELERMRVLLVRVAGRVAGLPEPEPDEHGGDDGPMLCDLEAVERVKVQRLLDSL
ncbi:kinetochore Sim4 complex subunit Fta4 [Xylariomycetidae sp. FL0641]|nr:kinetochore Sim4 complex subunit Fta4 [Xylariomycetidae sp. FL0641]